MRMMNTYLKCPHCKSILSYVMIASCNTLWATRYSDGKIMWDCLPKRDNTLSVCSVCKGYLWNNELKGPSIIDRLFKSKKHFIKILELEDYIKALDSAEMKDPDKEYHIRKQIRWGFNDRIRKNDWSIKDLTKSEEEKKIWKDNLERLAKMYEKETITPDAEEGHEEYLDIVYQNRAEVLRELGRFDACIDKIEHIKDKRYDKSKEKVLKACQEKNPYVIVLYEDPIR